LGGEVDNPNWKAIWPGKKVYDLDASDTPKIEVVKGAVDRSGTDAQYLVDGLSGATLTSRGITNLVQYWAGEHGFQQYLNRLRSGV
jgi:Na+-transporting NADH:ubiquinone oxidoreductase subunit C